MASWLGFGFRLALGLFAAWAVAFGTANYVTEKFAGGYVKSVTALNNSMDRLTKQIRSESADLLKDNDGLSRDLTSLTEQLRDTTGTLSSLDGTIKGMDARLNASIARQREFERYVLNIILRSSPPPVKTAAEIEAAWGVSPETYKLIFGPQNRPTLDTWADFGAKIIPTP